MIEKNKGFQIFANIIFIILCICIILPFILLISSSITSEESLIKLGYGLLPKELDFTAYKVLLVDSAAVIRSYWVSFYTTFIGTIVNLTLTTLFAYPLSRKDLPGRNIFALFLFFTMLFNGGLVSNYM